MNPGTCPNCGSKHVWAEATAYWTGEYWTLSNPYDPREVTCMDCEHGWRISNQ